MTASIEYEILCVYIVRCKDDSVSLKKKIENLCEHDFHAVCCFFVLKKKTKKKRII